MVSTQSATCPSSPLRAHVIFVVAGDNKDDTVPEIFKMRYRCFKDSVELVQAERGSVLWLFGDFAETHRQPSLLSGNQRC